MTLLGALVALAVAALAAYVLAAAVLQKRGIAPIDPFSWLSKLLGPAEPQDASIRGQSPNLALLIAIIVVLLALAFLLLALPS